MTSGYKHLQRLHVVVLCYYLESNLISDPPHPVSTQSMLGCPGNGTCMLGVSWEWDVYAGGVLGMGHGSGLLYAHLYTPHSCTLRFPLLLH